MKPHLSPQPPPPRPGSGTLGRLSPPPRSGQGAAAGAPLTAPGPETPLPPVSRGGLILPPPAPGSSRCPSAGDPATPVSARLQEAAPLHLPFVSPKVTGPSSTGTSRQDGSHRCAVFRGPQPSPPPAPRPRPSRLRTEQVGKRGAETEATRPGSELLARAALTEPGSGLCRKQGR